MGPSPSLANVIVMHKMITFEFLVVGCCDFIAQSILIYRCWIVWGHDIPVVILPIILVFAFLATWVACITPITTAVEPEEPPWAISLLLFSLAASMTVNFLVTSLIVFQNFRVFQEGKIQFSGNAATLGSSTHGTRFRSIIFILIESGAALFCIQLVRLTVTIVTTNTSAKVFALTTGIHEMLIGLTPTIILVRVSMGLTFHDETSLVAS